MFSLTNSKRRQSALCLSILTICALTVMPMTVAVAQQGTAQVEANGAQTSNLRPYAPGTPQNGIGGTPDRPARAVLRSDEDWSWLASTSEGERRPLDDWKHIPLSADGTSFLTFGFDGRIGFENFNDERFGSNAGSDTTLHVRANPHLSLTIAERFRFYGALKYGHVGSSDFSPSVAEDDGPDVHQLFAEVSLGDLLGLQKNDALVRIGRQELHYGTGRIISIRNGPNVRFDYDGAMARIRLGATVSEAFYVRPTENDAGSFNNDTDDTQALWGFYTSTKLNDFFDPSYEVLNRGNLDLYYVGFERETSPYAFQAAPLDETRHTVGARFWTSGPPSRGWGIDVEAAYQFGTARGIVSPSGASKADISAAFIAGDLTYGLEEVTWSPILGLRFGLSSGDGDIDDDTLTTFRAPFPPGRYFGDSNPIGPGNVAGVGPSLAIQPFEGLTLTGRYQAFWRIEEEDGLYSPPQVPLRGTAGNASFVGQEFALSADYTINEYTSLNGSIAHFDTGSYLSDNQPSEDATYVDMKLTFSF